VTHSITSFVAHYGVYAVFVLMAIDAVFPAASELVMLYAGALAAGTVAHRHPSLFGAELPFGVSAYIIVASAGTLGYFAGSIIGWLIGFLGGRPLLAAHGSRLHLTAERLDDADRWFNRYGNLTAFVGRLTPVVRSFISIPAGVFAVGFSGYAFLTLLGSALWAFAFAAAGWGLGTGYQHLHHDFRWAEITVAAGVITGALILTLRQRRRAEAAAQR
jgi:membrane protein DedA with SNARE-associated domain